MIARLRDTSDELMLQHWLSHLWNVGGVDVSLNETGLWVRCAGQDESVTTAILQRLPGAERFEIYEGDLLCAVGDTVPSEHLRVAQWYSVNELASLVLPNTRSSTVPAEAMHPSSRVPLRWNATEATEEAQGLICRWNTWYLYALQASLKRLRHLRFAVNLDGATLVIGSPVPSIPGKRLLEYSRILLPSPNAWFPHVPASVIRTKLGVDPNEWLLWTDENELQTIPDCRFVPANRTSIRATHEALLVQSIQ